MAQRRAWIRADVDPDYGSLHLFRAIALAQAARKEGLEEITIITRAPGDTVINAQPVDGVKVEVWPEEVNLREDAEKAAAILTPLIPKRVDTRHPRPLIYLIGNRFDVNYQRYMWKLGAETVVMQEHGADTYADWCVVPKPYGGELNINSQNGYTYHLRGAHYTPLRINSMKSIFKQHDHKTFASHFAIATENLDAAKWIPKLSKAIAAITPPEGLDTKNWKPSLTILPGPFCPGDDELKKLVGNGLDVAIHDDRMRYDEALTGVDVVFAPDGIVLHEVLALGTVRVALPKASNEKNGTLDMMRDHLVRREASADMPAPDSDTFDEEIGSTLLRLCFDPAYRRAQSRIGQYLCDGIGSFRVVRQTAYQMYTVPQNIIRFFEMGDPLIEKL